MMTFAPPKQQIAQKLAKIAAAEAAKASVPRPEEAKPEGDRKLEERVVQTPIDRTQLGERSRLLEEIKSQQDLLEGLSGHEREQAEVELRSLVDQYKSIGSASPISRREVGVEVEKAPAFNRKVHAVASRVLGEPAANLIVDTRDREIHHILEEHGQIPDEVDVDSALNSWSDGKEKASEILGKIRATRDPGEVASLVQELNDLREEYHGASPRTEVGDLARKPIEAIGEEAREHAGAETGETLSKTIEDRTKIAETQAVEGDLPGAAAQMKEVQKETVSQREALKMIKQLKEQAAYLAVSGDAEGAQEKVAEMTLVSSSLPEQPKQALVEVPKTPNGMINSIEQNEGVDADGALKLVGEMHQLSRRAREQGMVDADACDVYRAGMEIKAELQEIGRNTGLTDILGNEFDRERIISRMAEEIAAEEGRRLKAA